MSWFQYRGGSGRGDSHQRQRDWNQPLPPPGEAQRQALVNWEARCRGYHLFDYPVPLEPAFSAPPGPLPWNVMPDTSAPQSLQFLQLLTPAEQKLTVPAVDGWLRALSCLHSPLCFEILADSNAIVYQLALHSSDLQNVTLQLPLHFPRCELYSGGDYLQNAVLPYAQQPMASSQPIAYSTVEFGLSEFSFISLRRFSQLTADPMVSVIGALGVLESGEVAGIQLRLFPTRQPWGEALSLVAGEMGMESPKSSQMLFACGLRVFALSTYGYGRAFSLCQSLGQALSVLDEPGQNGLLALSPEALGEDVLLRDVLERKSHRPGFMLSLEEVRGLAHPPSETVQHPKLLRSLQAEETLSPELLEGPGPLLGKIAPSPDGLNSQLTGAPLFWPDAYRTHHAYVLGATRMGKSTLLLNLMTQDLQSGHGLCLIDPHGDLAQDVLQRVPEHRQGDVLYLNLADREFPLALGLLEARDEWEERLVCSDILSILRRLFASSWGDRLEHILRHVLLTLLAQPACKHPNDDDVSNQFNDTHFDDTHSFHQYLSSRRPTLRDIRPLLSHKGYREALLQNINDPDLLAFWQGEFPAYSASTFAPIYNKLGLLLSSGLVRNIVAQSQSKLSFPDLIQNKKVVLVNLSAGLIGEDNAHFLGALLVSKLQIAAMQSLRYQRHQRTPFTLYVDEFQHFVVSSFEKILSEAGKAGLSLVMANQFLEQLPGFLQSAILGNVGTIASFRVSSESGRLLERELAGKVTGEQFVSLQRGEAVVRISSAKDTALIHTLPPPVAQKFVDVQEITESTRKEICRARHAIESELGQERDLWEQLLQAEAEGKARAKASSSAPSRNTSPANSPFPNAQPKSESTATAGLKPTSAPKTTSESNGKNELKTASEPKAKSSPHPPNVSRAKNDLPLPNAANQKTIVAGEDNSVGHSQGTSYTPKPSLNSSPKKADTPPESVQVGMDTMDNETTSTPKKEAVQEQKTAPIFPQGELVPELNLRPPSGKIKSSDEGSGESSDSPQAPANTPPQSTRAVPKSPPLDEPESFGWIEEEV